MASSIFRARARPDADAAAHCGITLLSPQPVMSL